jgi:hypothetical protein
MSSELGCWSGYRPSALFSGSDSASLHRRAVPQTEYEVGSARSRAARMWCLCGSRPGEEKPCACASPSTIQSEDSSSRRASVLGCVGVAEPRADFGPRLWQLRTLRRATWITGTKSLTVQTVSLPRLTTPAAHGSSWETGTPSRAVGEPTGTGIETSMSVEFTVQIPQGAATLNNPTGASRTTRIPHQYTARSPSSSAVRGRTTSLRDRHQRYGGLARRRTSRPRAMGRAILRIRISG